MITVSNRSRAALRYLWTFSALNGHPRAGAALDLDRNTIDLECLAPDDWAWSSGERVLIDVARAIAQGSGGCYVGELNFLDEHNRQVAIESLAIWLNGEHDGVSV
jgi:hypothetical protein